MVHFLPAASAETRATASDFLQAWEAGTASFALSTSGSTGSPKTISVLRARMEASAAATAEALGLATGQQALVCLNPAYIGGKMALVRGLLLGWEIYLTEPRARALADWPLPTPPYHASLVPLQLETTLTDPILRTRLEDMHSVLIGGAPLSPTLEATASEVTGVALYQTFGMTETVSHIALRRLNGPEASLWYTLLPGHEARLDARDCLSVRGPVTGGEWVDTNDRVELYANRFRWLGRADFTINTGGLKLQPELLEAELAPHLAALGYPQAFYITAAVDERLGQHIVLVLEAQPGDAETLRTELTRRLPRFHAPREIRFMPTFPRTPTGKIIRSSTL